MSIIEKTDTRTVCKNAWEKGILIHYLGLYLGGNASCPTAMQISVGLHRVNENLSYHVI